MDNLFCKIGIPATKFDYVEKMQLLFNSSEYFLALQQTEARNDYYDGAVDPDGILRNALHERDLWVCNNKELLNFIKKRKTPENFLDFGCGPGYLMDALGFKNSVGVESSHLARNFETKSYKIFESLEQIDIDMKFDLIVMNHVIEHLTSPIETLYEIVQRLQIDGTLIIGLPNFFCAMSERFRENYRMLNEPTHVSLFSEYSIIRLLKDFGLKIEEVKYPFFDSPYFNKENLLKVLEPNVENIVSPPSYGNFLLISGQRSK